MNEQLSVRYSPHPFFLAPERAAAIWRYMDFTKFVSLIDTNALFFPRADHLSDRWEGAYTQENLRRRRFMVEEIKGAGPEAMMEDLSRLYRSLPLHTFVSCWHLNDVESDAMWQLYASRGEGIAIQSTFECLASSFQADENSMFDVYVGKVRYLDYERGVVPEGNSFLPFLHKRSSFEHEHELRAVIQPISPGTTSPLAEAAPFADGLLVNVDLHLLIQNIYVAPTSREWFTTLVEKIARKYGVDAPIKQSDLQRDPLY
jgi:hypothetical protein